MPICVPIKDMKDTAAFTRTVQQANGPVTVTKNGYDELVVMTSKDYEALQQELAQMRLMSIIAQTEHEYATGQYTKGEEFIEQLKEKYGL